MNLESDLKPLTYTQAQNAAKVSCFDISLIFKNYQVRPIYNDNGTFLEFDGERVFELTKDGEVVKAPRILESSAFGDSNFYSAVDILVEHEGYTYDAALKEVFYSTNSTATSYTSVSPDILKMLSSESIIRIKPLKCSLSEWNEASYTRKVYLLNLLSSDTEKMFIANRFGIKLGSAVQQIYPNKFAQPSSRKSCEHVLRYLINDLSFSSSFVTWLISKHLIYEDNKFNLVFPGFDEKGVIRWAYIRSSWNRRDGDSNAPYPISQVVSDSIPEYSWRYINPMSKTVYIFEDILELISYMNLMKIYNDHFPNEPAPVMELSSFLYVGHYVEGEDIPAALSGFIKTHPRVKKVIICFSKDREGVSTANYLNNKINSMNKLHSEVLSFGEYETFRKYLKDMQELIRTGVKFRLE